MGISGEFAYSDQEIIDLLRQAKALSEAADPDATYSGSEFLRPPSTDELQRMIDAMERKNFQQF